MVPRRPAFTLTQLLVIVAIVLALVALLFPLFVATREASRMEACYDNLRRIGLATVIYVSDFDGTYPETKGNSADPATTDADGSLNKPDHGSVFPRIHPYLTDITESDEHDFACPDSGDPFGSTCAKSNSKVLGLTAYVISGYYVFGLKDASISQPESSIMYAERRSEAVGSKAPYCDYVYYPWFNSANPRAPEDDMDPVIGTIATTRHRSGSTYAFADLHIRQMAWSETYSPPTLNLHGVTKKSTVANRPNASSPR